MTNGHLVNHDVDQPSIDRMQVFYDRRLIPAEKKPFLIDLSRCAGPLLAVEGQQYILDVASQIASKGLGFNAGAMFGAAQFLETWTGNDKSAVVGKVRQAFESLMGELTGWSDLHVQLCNSGAEANETALGMCYRNRKHAAAKKVIAFQGAFHGRMMVALASTWNVKKREPFAWQGFETSYAPYPEMPLDDIQGPAIPAGWQAAWATATGPDCESKIRQQFASDDALLNAELDSLLAVRQLLASEQHYAVLVEPMQCEGGDRYTSARFHNGLVNLARAFEVPLVYDEIQTGFGLGGDFFWHQKFDLRDAHGAPLSPDHVVLAKKAQVGMVLSHQVCEFVEQYNVASLNRGFIHASMIVQFREEIDKVEERNRAELAKLIQKHGDRILRPRASGLSFAFDFADPARLKDFISKRFQYGLLYYPAGERSARFRFNLAFRGELLDLAWRQIDAALAATLSGSSKEDATKDSDNEAPAAAQTPIPAVAPYLDFHKRFISGKLMSMQEMAPLSGGAAAFLNSTLDQFGIDAQVVFLTEANWQQYRQQVWDLQGIIYEPLRQTEITKFDALIAADHSLAIAVVKDDAIIAMAFAAPPINFPKERGVADDPYFEDPDTVYMLDLTVVPEYRGRLGRVMKQAFCLAAQAKGLKAIQGRNRDRLARGMWAINLSMGSFCTRVLKDDYLDEHAFRDCLVYRCELDWQDEPIYLSNAVHQPLDSMDLDETFCESNLSLVTNKLTLSNFVTHDYLRQLERVFGLLPRPLQHGYSASGMSECVDKLIKSIWLKRNPRRRMISIGESFFGHGSFLSRSLSGIDDPLFESINLPDDERLLDSLKEQIETDETLAVFVEPLGCLTGKRIAKATLIEISKLCRQFNVPLVSHDSAGMFHRYDVQAFLPTAMEGFTPDAGMVFLGGQMAVCYMREEFFVETPLMFISTWEGDALSLAQFDHALTVAESDSPEDLMSRFDEVLQAKLRDFGVTEFELAGGVGWFRGKVDDEFAAMFRQPSPGLFISCPSVGAIKKFLAHFHE